MANYSVEVLAPGGPLDALEVGAIPDLSAATVKEALIRRPARNKCASQRSQRSFPGRRLCSDQTVPLAGTPGLRAGRVCYFDPV